ncbi:DNA-binding NarL/FixJ family response regulator [Silvibacterium bohemicum]|uniref:DNA-binding NarL/FixJ family response regulator n=1 Tax=Silvibacterium bohemicum TaxID=1577686 RepID=A0A841JU13_9BACT|nr:response regulator transcription factor [Silvibacterium bohemicum]MBB6143995.1 DNA-binding NarL/FixJ family response regulator [Silvibacterium bohemicum]
MNPVFQRDVPLRIGLLDFEPIRVAGFETVFSEVPSVDAVTTTLSEAMADTTLDMVLVSLQNPLDSFETLAKLKTQRPSLKLIVMGSHANEETIISAIAAGAKGYLEETASPELVTQCIAVVDSGSIWAPRKVLSKFVDRMLHATERRVLRHNFNFTGREQEVLRLLVAARSNREIAESLGIEERTVKAYIARLMRKVGVQNRIALSIHAASRVLGTDKS